MDKKFPWVAILDDELPIRRALLRLLRSAGIRAQAFASGEDLFTALQQTNRPACVILDLHMAAMSGFDVQVMLALQAPEIRTIVITGHHSPEVHARAMACKPIAYLLKPMNDQLLLDAIASAFDARRLT